MEICSSNRDGHQMSFMCRLGFHKWIQRAHVSIMPLAQQWWFCRRCNKVWHYFEMVENGVPRMITGDKDE
jgi:hypothetical protein